MTDLTTWPDGFYDIGNRTFRWVHQHKPEFVDFTLTEMQSPSGLFLAWQNYCKKNKRNDDDTFTGLGCEKQSIGLRER